MPVNVTVTAQTGPGLSTTADVYNDVRNLEFDFIQQVMTITKNDGSIVQFAYSTIATFTWVISGSTSTLTIST